MNPNKSVKIPVATHGLHPHKVNVPRSYTTNFFEHIPSYSAPFYKGEKMNLDYHFFTRLQPMPVPSLVTGRVAIRGYFVPMRTIFKGWYDFHAGTPHVFGDGSSAVLSSDRYFVMGEMVSYWINNPNLMTLVRESDGYDVTVINGANVVSWYQFTPLGCVVYKIFRALGYAFSWDTADTFEFNCLRLLAYLRVMMDNYFPRQYVNNNFYQSCMGLLEADTPTSLHVSAETLTDCIAHVLYGWYDDSFFDSAWDNPVSINIATRAGKYTIKDITNNSAAADVGVSNDPAAFTNPSSIPTNGTPYIGNTPRGTGSTTGAMQAPITQFLLDSLQSLNNFIKRHQLAGSRLIENFLVSRGVSLPERVINVSYKLNSYSIPFEITPVANTNGVAIDDERADPSVLGELAGRGEVGSGNENLNFKSSFDDDGLFIVLHVAIPDTDTLVANDPWNMRITPLSFLHGEFDKLGVEDIPSRVLAQLNNGYQNRALNVDNFGFLNRYYADAFDAPLQFGDFDIPLRGALHLDSYTTFRKLYQYIQNNGWHLNHSYDYVRTQLDENQFFRLFYTDTCDSMTTYVRIKGHKRLFKLPLGDSYDFDDDEFNKKVSVLNAGSED